MHARTPMSDSLRKTRRRFLLFIPGITLVFLYLLWPSLSNGTLDYADIGDHFKYGSIGSEPANGIPYWIWKALPELFADKLPGPGYASLGFIQEEGQDRPIGFSSRRVLIDRVSLNCGVCHTGTVSRSARRSPSRHSGDAGQQFGSGGVHTVSLRFGPGRTIHDRPDHGGH